MAAYDFGRRFHESTRGRVVELLRGNSRTVEELARELELTDNAVRTHLATLERDGIVRQEGVRRGPGAGKPASIFGIAPDAEPRFSNAYIPLLTALLEELADRHSPRDMNEIMHAVGRKLGEPHMIEGDQPTRRRAVASLLQQFGAVADVVENGNHVTVTGHGCVVGLAVDHSPSVCQAMAALLESVSGEVVHERCSRNGRASCCFQIGGNGTDPSI